MIGKILVAVDGSDNNKKAVDEAVALAKALGADLNAVYVTNNADIRPNAFGGDASAQERAALVEKESKEAFSYINKASEAAGIELNCILVSGQPGTEIVKLTSDYDLIVCGTLGRTGLSKVIIGSVSSAIVKYSECPVMVTR
ncbi:MAG: universal stress protein [Candidatus Methanomethylophilaceae archaeon]|nr:universal stress protein [Candidatus Methanomethylophilaceae archaeon]